MSQPFSPSYALVETTDEFEALCERLISDGKPFGFDIETSYDGEPREEAQLHPEENFPCGLSFTNAPTWARYAALRHDNGENLDNYRCAVAFWKVLQTGFGVAHGAKFELRVLSRWFMEHLADHPLFGAAVRAARGYFPIRSCTLLESYSEGENPEHGLKEITIRNFGHQMANIMSLFPKMTKKEEKSIRFSELNQRDQKVIDYACEDSLWSLAHHYKRYGRLKDFFIYQLEMNVLPIVCAMEDEGLFYDWNFMREGAQRGAAFRDKLSTEISNDLTVLVQAKDPSEPPVKINLGSWKQKADILYGKLGMSTRRRTGSGAMSTDKIALKGLSQQYPVVKKMLNWTSLTKLIGTYLEVYPKRFAYAPDGRTHPGHLQHGVPAGRFAVASPPYQQSPKKYHFELADGTTFDFNFRDAVCAPRGWYMIGFDYAQQELRVLAGEAGEMALIEAFANGEDVHVKTAALMLGKQVEEIIEAERDVGKTMNFALSYQMGVDSLADRLGIPKEAAQQLYDQYFAVYNRIKSWLERTIAGAKARGYITTRFGRKVRIFEFESTERWRYAEGERLAGNAPIQGAGTGDYPKIAMVRADKAIKAAGLQDGIKLVMNMHDALEFYVRDDIPPALVIRILQPAVVFPVEGWPPIVAEWHCGRRWGSVKNIELLPDGSIRLKEKSEPAPAELDGDPDEEEVPAVKWVQPVPARSRAGHSAVQPGMPAYDPALASVVPPAVADHVLGRPAASPRTVIISLTRMPTQDEFTVFARSFGQGTGQNEVLLSTPQGDLLIARSLADPVYEPQIAMALGGAAVTYAPSSVDTSALAAGLRL